MTRSLVLAGIIAGAFAQDAARPRRAPLSGWLAWARRVAGAGRSA